VIKYWHYFNKSYLCTCFSFMFNFSWIFMSMMDH